MRVAQARERTLFDTLAGSLFDKEDQKTLDQGHDILFSHEGHFQVKLGKFGLAIRTLIFVAEAARDLEVTVKAGHHQQLLELLGRLWQRVELTRIEAAGDEVVARPPACSSSGWVSRSPGSRAHPGNRE